MVWGTKASVLGAARPSLPPARAGQRQPQHLRLGKDSELSLCLNEKGGKEKRGILSKICFPWDKPTDHLARPPGYFSMSLPLAPCSEQLSQRNGKAANSREESQGWGLALASAGLYLQNPPEGAGDHRNLLHGIFPSLTPGPSTRQAQRQCGQHPTAPFAPS